MVNFSQTTVRINEVLCFTANANFLYQNFKNQIVLNENLVLCYVLYTLSLIALLGNVPDYL